MHFFLFSCIPCRRHLIRLTKIRVFRLRISDFEFRSYNYLCPEIELSHVHCFEITRRWKPRAFCGFPFLGASHYF
jgi:hypothetical protein